tara:strand:+ start:609 stop:797 length:189 start_codon:yes stop_codon:yes gene_type:complete
MSILDNIKYYANKAWLLTLEFMEWHAEAIEDFADKYDFSAYGMAVLGFLKGVLVVLVLQWIF